MSGYIERADLGDIELLKLHGLRCDTSPRDYATELRVAVLSRNPAEHLYRSLLSLCSRHRWNGHIGDSAESVPIGVL
jgi:hypothetical protein